MKYCRYEDHIRKCKKKARSELDKTDWNSRKYSENFDLSLNSFSDSCERIDAMRTSYARFREEFEHLNRPVIIQNDQLDWRARKRWQIKHLAHKYGSHKLKCGEDDDGYSVRIKFKYFIHYMRNNDDDSPMYIFDGNFGDHRKLKKLLSDYSVSKFFPEDLFRISKQTNSPPFRWFCVGPARSGTVIHVDPLSTSAWNALVIGYKRWCLFPPTTPKSLISLKPSEGGKQKQEAITWFVYVYPRTRKSDWPNEYRPIEVLQAPGETIFVPHGWWHVVINLTDTVAVTHNFCSSTNFPYVWHKTARSRPKFAKRWLQVLRIKRPDLAVIADQTDLSRPLPNTPDESSSSSSGSSSSSSENSYYCD